MSALPEISMETVLAQTGEQRHVRRRLGDKILAAFNHAYSAGEYEIAKQLKAALAHSGNRPGMVEEKRSSYDPLAEAELWIRFVDARNRYSAACKNSAKDVNAVAEFLESMKDAYRQWSAR